MKSRITANSESSWKLMSVLLFASHSRGLTTWQETIYLKCIEPASSTPRRAQCTADSRIGEEKSRFGSWPDQRLPVEIWREKKSTCVWSQRKVKRTSYQQNKCHELPHRPNLKQFKYSHWETIRAAKCRPNCDSDTCSTGQVTVSAAAIWSPHKWQ